MRRFSLILSATIVIALSGCASTSALLQDQQINRTANNSIYQQLTIDKPSNVGISTQNGIVLITGQIPTEELKNQVSTLVNDLDGVKKVYNFLEVGPPVSAGVHLTDSWITTKIKSEFIANKQITPSAIKVVTEDGVVYLMGNVTPSMGAAAINIAKTTDNVREVVKIFQYTHLNETST